MIGRQFGSLIVAFRDWSATRPTAPYAARWICLCDCDRLVTVAETALVRREVERCEACDRELRLPIN